LIPIGSSAASSNLSKNIVIEGRLLPTSEPYCQRSFRVRFTFPPGYPFAVPKLFCLDYIYHPNIDKRGRICIPILNEYEGYGPAISLSKIITSVEHLIGNPVLEHAINLEAAAEYQLNRHEFNQKALDYVLRYGHSRT
jgi:ubiquitin-protein ligase